jgi:GntR family transcriptional regulator / MocR family aminotransferase
LVARHYRATSFTALDYSSDLLGYQPLRAAIAGYLARARAVNCNHDQIIIVNGSQQALDLIARLLIDQDDCVAIEDPGYLGARRIFLSNGAKLLPLSVDENGVVLEQLYNLTDQIKLIYLTPSHQFPTGAVLPLSRRLALLDWAEQHGAMIIEDDYDSEYRYSGRPIPSLQGLDRNGAVIYAGTFSKVMFPALRIGYLVVAPEMVDLFAHSKWLSDRQTPILEQIVLTDFINSGQLERHIRRMRTLYDRRRETLVRALQNHFKDLVTIIGESAGIHLMARFELKLKDLEVIERASSVGVELIAAGQQYLKKGDYREFIFGYANLSEYKIQTGIKRLAKVLLNKD